MTHLTKRQQEFLKALVDLYHEEGDAIHYSLVAKIMGVGKVATYEMLRLLEEYGLAEREFRRPEEDRGPGRSPVAFRPTALAAPTLAEHGFSDRISEEWMKVKSRILEKLRKGKSKGYDDLLRELLEHIPQRRSPVIFLAETVTAVVLGMHSLREFAEARHLRSILSRIGIPGESGLSAIPGLSVGLSLVERFNERLSEVLLNQTHRYQAFLKELSAEKRRLLAEFTREVVEIVES
jgi:hypothetical protein